MKSNNTPQSKAYGSRKIASAFILVATFCFAESLRAAAGLGGTQSAPVNAQPNDQPAPPPAPLGQAAQVEQLSLQQLDLNIELHAAAMYDEEYEAIKALIAEGAHINSKDDDGNTPLHIAARNGNVNNCRVLLRAGANRDIRNYHNETPLDIANHAWMFIRSNNLSSVIAILNNPAVPDAPVPPSKLRTYAIASAIAAGNAGISFFTYAYRGLAFVFSIYFDFYTLRWLFNPRD